MLLNLLRRNVKDERVIQWIKRYLKSGVMENGVVMETEEGSPQGGNISPLLANIYLNEFDKEYEKRDVRFVRYADDIVLLAKSDRAARRLLETSTKYLEGTLKLKVNQEKSRVVSVFAIRNFKYLGFTLGKNGKGIYIRVHGKSWKKMKSKLKELSSRRTCQSIRPVLEKIKVFMRGWLNYYGIISLIMRAETVLVFLSKSKIKSSSNSKSFVKSNLKNASFISNPTLAGIRLSHIVANLFFISLVSRKSKLAGLT